MELYGLPRKMSATASKCSSPSQAWGPKAALSILSATTPEGLATAIITGDEKALTVAPGIGKKIAQRVILELKDKLARASCPWRRSATAAPA